MKSFWAFALILFLGSPVFAASARLERINTLFEMNEAGFAWVQHCTDYRSMLSQNPHYTANAQVVMVALTKQLAADQPGFTAEYAQGVVLQRRDQIGEAFAAFYKENGCRSPQAQAAKQHFEQSSKNPPESTAAFVRNIGNR